MARIFSISPLYEIFIDDNFILIDEEDYISFELPNGFNWLGHSNACKDCSAFLGSFGKSNYQWNLEASGNHYLLKLQEIGKIEEYIVNAAKFEISNNFNGTKFRIEKIEVNLLLLEAYQILEEKNEEFKKCQELQNVKEYLKNDSAKK